jgi:hypothetical protein
MTNKEMFLRDALNAANQLEKLKDELLVTVSGARRHGASWAEIGGAVGMTKQAAQQRWGKLTPAPLKTTDELADDDGQTPATPSIFLEAPAPAKDEFTRAHAAATAILTKEREQKARKLDASVPANSQAMTNDPDFDPKRRTKHKLPGEMPTYAEQGTGTGAHACIGCGSTNHKGVTPMYIYFNPECAPTRYDPQRIKDFIMEANK